MQNLTEIAAIPNSKENVGSVNDTLLIFDDFIYRGIKCIFFLRNFLLPKYWDRRGCANSADPDQTAPKEQSDQGLHCLPLSPQVF